ncbi:MAG: hypothetical protein C0594_15420 [Marinilabiliales bacterium]|nr:MAG: hypothetical protein C0594_15420 [Marinilabiliales bacterium]
MTYFADILVEKELKQKYRQLALMNHPDKGGMLEKMQKINEEYSFLISRLGKVPDSISNVEIGNKIFVNKSECIVTGVTEKLFTAKSLRTRKVAHFDKETGFALFNFKLRASVFPN